MINISAGDAPLVNDWQHAANDTAKATAESRGAYFVDVFSASAGHDACQPNEANRWTTPEPAATPVGWPLHPTIAGHTAVAALFVNAYNSPRPFRNGSTPPGQSLKIGFRSKKVRAVTSRVKPISQTAPRRHGAKLTVTLAHGGSVKFLIDRARPGHLKNGKCRSLSKRASKGRKACTRYVKMSSATALALPGGTSNVYFTGRAHGKRLSNGRYRLRVAIGSLSARTRTFSLKS